MYAKFGAYMSWVQKNIGNFLIRQRLKLKNGYFLRMCNTVLDCDTTLYLIQLDTVQLCNLNDNAYCPSPAKFYSDQHVLVRLEHTLFPRANNFLQQV